MAEEGVALRVWVLLFAELLNAEQSSTVLSEWCSNQL